MAGLSETVGFLFLISHFCVRRPGAVTDPKLPRDLNPSPRHRPVVGTEIPPEAIQNAFACERHLRAAGRLLPLLSAQQRFRACPLRSESDPIAAQ